MTPPTYDEIRAAAVPCRGGCGQLLAGDWGPLWLCVRCAHLAVQTVGTCPECGPVAGWDEDGCCRSCGEDIPEAHGLIVDRFRRAQPDSHEGGME